MHNKNKLIKLNVRTYLEINSKHVGETSQRHLNGLVQIPLLIGFPLLYLLLQKSVGFSLLHSGRDRVEPAVVACVQKTLQVSEMCINYIRFNFVTQV